MSKLLKKRILFPIIGGVALLLSLVMALVFTPNVYAAESDYRSEKIILVHSNQYDDRVDWNQKTVTESSNIDKTTVKWSYNYMPTQSDSRVFEIGASQKFVATRQAAVKYVTGINSISVGRAAQDYYTAYDLIVTIKVGNTTIYSNSTDFANNKKSIYGDNDVSGEPSGTLTLEISSTATSKWYFQWAYLSINGYSYKSVTSTLNDNGGTGGQGTVGLTYGETMPNLSKIPTRSGYAFKGYYIGTKQYYKADGKPAISSFDIKSDSITLTASWELMQFDVTLNDNGGTGGQGTVTAIYGSSMPNLSKVPTRTGYTFGGYYTEENGGGTQYYNADGTSAKNWDKSSATTLYAKWTLLPVIQEVVDKINTIGGQTNVAYPQSKSSIEAAEAAYKALIEEYPEYASAISDKYLELQNDRTQYEDIKESLVNDAIAKINAIGDVKYTNTSKGLIDSADLAYAKLTDEDKTLVTNSLILAQANTDYDNVDEVVNNQNAIAFEYSDTAKDAIDIARSGYNDLSEYQKSIYPQESLNELVEYENAYTAMDKINNITMKNSNECKQSIVDARNTIDQLTEAEMALVNTSFIESLENDEMAFDVIETINDINKPKYTKESKELIDNARASYDALSDEQKALVVNYTTLTKDEDDYQKVDVVANEINNIGSIRYNEESNSKIKDARESYKSLSKDQKAFFPSAEQESLQNYEESYKVLEKIYSIGNVEYNNKSQKLIDDARKAYDSLTDEQKALIDSDDFNVLVTSEDDFSSKDSNVKWLFIVILIICYAVIALAGIIRIIVAHKRNKDDENDNDNYNVKITIY